MSRPGARPPRRRGGKGLAELKGALALLGLPVLVPLIAASSVHAQESRASVGYEVRNYRYSADLNPDVDGETGALTSGALQAEYLRRLAGPLYASASASYLIHDDGFLLGGPARFDGWDVGLGLGLQGSWIGIFGALRGGRLGGIRGRAAGADGGTVWMSPSGSDGGWTASVGGGIRYFPLAWIEARARLMTALGDPVRIDMATGGPSAPVFRSAELDPATLSLSLSLSVPFGRSPSIPEAGTTDRRRPATEEFQRRAVAEAPRFVDPLRGPSAVTSPFGGGRGHRGVDLDAEAGEPVRAAAGGTVTRAGEAAGYGTMVELQHGDGFATIYAHLDELRVQLGQEVEQGTVIGTAGSTGRATGSHLHFEVLRYGRPVDPEVLVPFR